MAKVSVAYLILLIAVLSNSQSQAAPVFSSLFGKSTSLGVSSTGSSSDPKFFNKNIKIDSPPLSLLSTKSDDVGSVGSSSSSSYARDTDDSSVSSKEEDVASPARRRRGSTTSLSSEEEPSTSSFITSPSSSSDFSTSRYIPSATHLDTTTTTTTTKKSKGIDLSSPAKIQDVIVSLRHQESAEEQTRSPLSTAAFNYDLMIQFRDPLLKNIEQTTLNTLGYMTALKIEYNGFIQSLSYIPVEPGPRCTPSMMAASILVKASDLLAKVPSKSPAPTTKITSTSVGKLMLYNTQERDVFLKCFILVNTNNNYVAATKAGIRFLTPRST